MATSEQMRTEIERMNDDRRTAVSAVAAMIESLDDYAVAARALHAGIIAMARSWSTQAAALEDSTKRGAKGIRDNLRNAAQHASGFAGGLVSPEFLASLGAPGPQLEVAEVVAETVEVDAAASLDEVKAYLSGETNEVPTAASAPTIPTQRSEAAMFAVPEMVDPAPVAPPRLSWDEFARMVGELPPPEQGSFSMITSLADCGMAYALDRLARRDMVKPQPPAWWNVGGTALHRCLEAVERRVIATGDREAYYADAERQALWLGMFERGVTETLESSGVDPAYWRAADKGKENYDWWRVQGAEMLRAYVAYHSPTFREMNQILVMPDGRPALELELTLDLAGLPFAVAIDQVWTRAAWTPGGALETSLRIRDLKSGKTKQPSTFQIGGYAHALASAMPDAPTLRIGGAFYDARTASHDLECDDLLAKHPLIELRYRAHAAIQQARTHAYLPRVSIFGGGCSSCGHRAICPAQG